MADIETLMADVPADDPHFVLGVMAKIEQRRFRRELIRTGMLTLGAIILLALVMSHFDRTAIAKIGQDDKIGIALALMAATILWPRLSRS